MQFRQAVAHSIDKQRIIEEVQHGLAYSQWASISPGRRRLPQPQRPPLREYDLDKANEILDDLGWTDTNGDGIREDDQGNEIAFSW